MNKVPRNDRKKNSGLKRILHALKYSCDGLAAAWVDEAAFRQICILSIVFIILGLYFGNGFAEKILLILPCFLCIVAELINSAIENIIDLISTEENLLAKKAKDMGSALQLVCIVLFLIVWGYFVLGSF